MKNKAKSMWEQFAKVALSAYGQHKIRGGENCCGPGQKPPPPPKETAQANQHGG
jgi:hypothetical protein